MKKIRVLVVEDDSFTRSTLVATLEYDGFEVLGAADSASAAVASFNRHNHDVLLADLDLGLGPTGVELAWLLRKTRPDLGVVFLTSFEDPRLHRTAVGKLPSGSRYLIKQDLADRAQISQAIRYSVATGSNWEQGSSKAESRLTQLRLSSVQIETLRMIAEGLTNREIARSRFVSEKAVEQTVKRLATKLEISQSQKSLRVELARKYLKLTGGKA